MKESTCPRLCGGTFFTLVLQGLKQRTKAREHYRGERDGLSDPEVLVGLIRVINPDYNAPELNIIKSKTNEYKSCSTSTGKYFPFGNTAEMSEFARRIQTNYSSALEAMTEFVYEFLEIDTASKRDMRLVQEIKDLFEDDDMVDDEQEVTYPEYTAENFLDDVHMSEEDYSRLVGLLRNKKNIILQGAPGVGKTYAAKRLAYSMMGVKDVERVMMVQFHQSYSYEDFIMGFRPSATGFELKKGAFYNFCKKAEIDSDNEYFFIIDEINRGNLSKIFGELFMLIENDKRGNALQLLYSDEKFAVPKNVYIIGMMNTADRSLAMLDYALRRRFAFFDIKPGFETPGFREYRMALDNEKFNKLISCVENLNGVIASDESLGEGFCIGHSYFCNLQPDSIDDDWLYGVVEYELIPLLKEYWFDEPMKVKDWSENLRSAIK